MLTAAYAILGLKLVAGELVLEQDAFAGDRELRLRNVTYRGRELVAPSDNHRVTIASLAP